MGIIPPVNPKASKKHRSGPGVTIALTGGLPYIRGMKQLVTVAFIGLAAPLGAHPHIFVDTGLEVIVDAQGRATHVRVTWAYDALYSLLVTEDLGLDPDGDAVLNEAEISALTGFDMNWVEGFNGDLVASLGGQGLALSGPLSPTADMREGRVITTHLRQIVDTPELKGQVLSLKPYDATFYTAYDVTQGVAVRGMTCDVGLDVPEITEELDRVRAQLAALGVDEDPQDVGLGDAVAAFATDVKILCAQ